MLNDRDFCYLEEIYLTNTENKYFDTDKKTGLDALTNIKNKYLLRMKKKNRIRCFKNSDEKGALKETNSLIKV